MRVSKNFALAETARQLLAFHVLPNRPQPAVWSGKAINAFELSNSDTSTPRSSLIEPSELNENINAPEFVIDRGSR